mgnify:CR=1 FL=1
MKKNKITFWGVRGSFPTPDPDKIETGGHTSCVSIETENETLVMDMGTGIKNLGESIVNNPNSPSKINIILSHYHWDHIIGFPMFAPLFSDKYQINIYGKKDDIQLKEIINYMLNPIFWPVSFDDFKATVNFRTIENNEIKISDSMAIKSQIHHHPHGALSYKILSHNKTISYITDCEYLSGEPNDKLIQFSENSDLLIHDAHFTEEDLPNHKGWGHSSWKQATIMAQKSNSKQLALYHYSPNYNDTQISAIESDTKKVFSQTIAARQGLVIYL